MTPERINLVRRSFRQVVPIADQAADMFYVRLFELDPSLRRMFPADLGAQKRKLMAALGTAVNGIEDMDTLGPWLTMLGAKHEDYGVKDHHYHTVGQALIDTLRSAFGAAWTEELAEAWRDVYTTVAVAMQAGAALRRSMTRTAA